MEIKLERIPVDGLAYEASQVGLARQLRPCPGIIAVDVDVAAAITWIMYDENILKASGLRLLIEQCGYRIAVPDERRGSRASGNWRTSLTFR